LGAKASHGSFDISTMLAPPKLPNKKMMKQTLGGGTSTKLKITTIKRLYSNYLVINLTTKILWDKTTVKGKREILITIQSASFCSFQREIIYD